MKNYPIIDEDREHCVRYPVQVTEKDFKKNHSLKSYVDIGDWVVVDVVEDGYRHLLAPIPFKKKEDAQRAADCHNRFHGWSDEDVAKIINWSMSLGEYSATDLKEIQDWENTKYSLRNK